jgi:phosphoribosylanthranilate isomerase
VILSGGLSPANVAEAIGTVEPFAVDVASGVELEPGVKDHEKLEAFMAAAHAPPPRPVHAPDGGSAHVPTRTAS